MIVQTTKDYDGLRESGRILAAVLSVVQQKLVPGVSTNELNTFAEEKVASLGAVPAFKGYNGFPAGLCVSINEEVVHGIPGDRVVQEGDIVSIDFGVNYNGYFTDAAQTIVVGGVDDADLRRLLQTTERALDEGIAAALPGNTTGDIGNAIESVVESEGFGLIRELVGHGVGADVHEDPSVPNYGQPGGGLPLKEGMVLAIEPMIALGAGAVEQGPDGQVYRTRDHSIAAHVEHTIIVGSPPEIVTVL